MEETQEVAAALVDTGALYALADRKDSWHRRCVAFLDGFEGRLSVPSTVIPEACYLMGNHLGPDAEVAFIEALARGELSIIHFTSGDLSRSAKLMREYQGADVGFVDASVAAIAQRLRMRTILTTDRRHFALFRDDSGRPFDLKP